MTNANDFINKIETERSSDDFDNFSRIFSTGLTKREYYAGLAMQGLCANSNQEVCDKTTVNNGWHHPDTIAIISVQLSDALIKALNQPLTD